MEVRRFGEDEVEAETEDAMQQVGPNWMSPDSTLSFVIPANTRQCCLFIFGVTFRYQINR